MLVGRVQKHTATELRVGWEGGKEGGREGGREREREKLGFFCGAVTMLCCIDPQPQLPP